MRELATLVCVCILWCGSAAVAQTTPPRAIAVGDVVTGTFTPSSFSFATMTWSTEVTEMFLDLTVPSDGTLAAYLDWDPQWNPVGLQIDGVQFNYRAPFAGTIPVVAGRTYRVWLYASMAPWDFYDDVSFVFTTSLYPPGAAIPIGCQTDSPVSQWVCVNGDWVPPDHPLALAQIGSPAPPAPAPTPPSAASTCVTPQPVLNWVCINADWVPPDHPLAIQNGAGAPPPPPAPPSPPAASQPCVTSQPVSNWVCISGDWVPPDHPKAIANAGLPAPPPAPSPSAAPAAANCTTRDPFLGNPGLYGVCVGTEWYPVGHPLAPAGVAVTGVQPLAGPIGNWVRIFGVGFQSDTKVTFGGVLATDIFVESGGKIFAAAPPHSAGPVDVAVQNTGGLGATFAQPYTYHPVTLTLTPTVVSPGGLLTVSWVAPPAPFEGDWIGLFRVGDPNEYYLSYEYTGGTGSGSLTFVAPLQPGQYEFRYLPDDGYRDAARSLPITVAGGSAPVR